MTRQRSWTDDDLRSAVATARSLAEVVRALRLAHGGAAYLTVRTRIEQLELDTSHFRPSHATAEQLELLSTGAPSRSIRRWTDEELARAVAKATSLNGVFGELGLKVGGSQWILLRSRITSLGLDTTHWRYPLESRRAQTRERVAERLAAIDLRELAEQCRSRAELLRRVGIKPSATAYRALLATFAAQGIDPPALDGQRGGGAHRRPIEEFLVRGRPTKNAALRRRLISEGLKEPQCESCGIRDWHGEPAPLQLDHINGDPTDNRLENLRILCADCHAQTETWCVRNRGRGT